MLNQIGGSQKNGDDCVWESKSFSTFFKISSFSRYLHEITPQVGSFQMLVNGIPRVPQGSSYVQPHHPNLLHFSPFLLLQIPIPRILHSPWQTQSHCDFILQCHHSRHKDKPEPLHIPSVLLRSWPNVGIMARRQYVATEW